jgi:peptidoglycan/xylan/chitin deacetylase (PgdA/CDA1 family)
LKLLRWIPDRLVNTCGGSGGSSLHLTFDDGPHPEHTPALLDLLRTYQAKATFYLIGDQAVQYPHLVRQIVEDGHVLGNHSYSHPEFERLTLAEQLDEIERTDALLRDADGAERHPFRTPRGVLPARLLWQFMRQGRSISYWTYDSMDYSRKPAAVLVENMLRHPVRAGDIVLMHDDSSISLEMLHVLLPAWRSEGLSMESLSGQ